MPARALAAALSLFALLGCGAQDPGPVMVEAEPVALFPDDPGRTGLGSLRFEGALALTSQAESFGGWSALDLSDDGSRLLAVSDQGAFMTARLAFDGARPSGLSDVTIAPMLGPDGAPLDGARADAEGLADLGDGRYAVSFERDHRIAVFELGADWSGIETAVETPFPAPPGSERLRDNAGIEALAATPERLYAGVEDPLVSGQPHTLWIYDRTSPAAPPRAVQLALQPGFGLTALTPGPDGALYLVERFWARDVGNRIRISRLAAGDLETASAGPLQPELLAEIGPEMTVDNIEAAAFAEIGGAPMLVLMSDDNFNPDQRTLLLAFRVEE